MPVRKRKYKAQSQLRTLQISRDNPKYLYKYMHRQRQSSPSPLALKLSDGSAADSLNQVVETFRQYFHGILNGPEPSSFPTINNMTFDSPLESVDFTILDNKKRLRTCNPYSSMVPNNVHLPDTQGSCGCPGPRFHHSL